MRVPRDEISKDPRLCLAPPPPRVNAIARMPGSSALAQTLVHARELLPKSL